MERSSREAEVAAARLAALRGEIEAAGPAAQTGLLKEYDVLRAEMLRRIELQHQMLALTLTFSGVYFGLALKGDQNSGLMLAVLPFLVLLIAGVWAQNCSAAAKISRYLRNYIEPGVPGLRYERYRFLARGTLTGPLKSLRSFERLGMLSSGGVFLGLQTASLLLSGLQANGLEDQKILLLLALPPMLGTGAIVHFMRGYLARECESWEEGLCPSAGDGGHDSPKQA